jgi:ABC-type nitrate/sulfonate/bicarbonate transport system permease component
MSTSPPTPEPQRTSITLSRLAAIFAVTFGLAFGLCTVSTNFNEKFGAPLIKASLAIEVICLVGLLVIGAMALVRKQK